MALFSFQVYRSLDGRSIAGPRQFCPEAVDSHFSDTGHLRLKFCSRALNPQLRGDESYVGRFTDAELDSEMTTDLLRFPSNLD
jgi:hypothetical protein